MLVQLKHDENRFAGGRELFGRFDGNNFMGPLEAQFFIEPLGEHNATKHPFRRGVEIVGFGALGPVLKIGDRDIVGQGKVFGPGQGAGEKNDETHTRRHRSHAVLVHSAQQACQGRSGARA